MLLHSIVLLGMSKINFDLSWPYVNLPFGIQYFTDFTYLSIVISTVLKNDVELDIPNTLSVPSMWHAITLYNDAKYLLSGCLAAWLLGSLRAWVRLSINKLL